MAVSHFFMDEILENTQLAFDEVNALSKTNLTKEDVLSLMISGYRLGVKNTGQMLGYDVEADIEDMYEALFVLIDGKTWEDRYDEHKKNDDADGMGTLVRSEYHRVYIRGGEDGADKVSFATGLGINKTWNTMLDDRVRDTHNYLEGMTIPKEEDFWTYDGDHAPGPGGFYDASNNANCRCILTYAFDYGQGRP